MSNRLEYQRKWHKDHPSYQKDLRQKNLERIRERDREYYHKTKEIQREYCKKYRIKNKDKINKQKKSYYQENKDEINQHNLENYQKNKEKIIKKNKEYRENNQARIYKWNNEFNKKWYRRNKDHVKILKKEYRKKKPEVILKAQIKHLKKLSIPFNLKAFQYKRALQSWANVIKKRDESCQICNCKEGLFAHHIIHRSKYPELSFVRNNGIMLCSVHHNEVHWNSLT